MAAECQASVGGAECGVLAVGRCVQCGKAFCQTHQAADRRPPNQITYVDQCAACLLAAGAPGRAAESRRMERRLYGQPHEAGDWANWDAARQALREGADNLERAVASEVGRWLSEERNDRR